MHHIYKYQPKKYVSFMYVPSSVIGVTSIHENQINVITFRWTDLLVSNTWTRQVLEKMAPYANENPIVNIHTRN